MARKIDGVSLGLVFAGSVFGYAGLKGISVPHALQAIVQGKSPATVQPTQQIAGSPAGSTGGGAGGSAGDVAAGQSEHDFFAAFLKDISAPVTDANLQAMYRWAAKEEPAWPPQASGISWTWNPLNITTTSGFGVVAVGHTFASFPTPQAGAFATAAFLLGNNYSAIVKSLRTGNGIEDSPEVAAELSAWSGGGYTSVNSGGG